MYYIFLIDIGTYRGTYLSDSSIRAHLFKVNKLIISRK